MYFYLTGVDHKTTPLDVRENIYRRRKDMDDFLTSRSGIEARSLITCNRIEIYAVGENADDVFFNMSGLNRVLPALSGYAYVKRGGKEVARHALRLACGLESQLRGEYQIFTQLKAWAGKEDFPCELGGLWHDVLASAERIRAFSGLKESRRNIADIVLDDLKKNSGIKDPPEIIVVGTGKIAELIARRGKTGARLNFIAHKNHVKAVSLAEVSGGRAFSFGDISELSCHADAVISATSSPHYVLKKEHFLGMIEKRKKPLYVYDLAFPRDVEPAVGSVDGVFLKNLRDLDAAILEVNRSQQEQVDLAAELVEETLEKREGAAYVN